MTNTQRRLPAEWEPQYAIQLTWPHKHTDWNAEPGMLEEVTRCYVRLAEEISKRENLIIVTPEPEEVIALLEEKLPMESLVRISLLECPTNDTWARDHSFITTVLSREGEENTYNYVDFRFNGWGGKFEAALDNAISLHLYDSGLLAPGEYEDALSFELEGGSIESDGRGTILTTAECNLNTNRRQGASREEILANVEKELRERLGAKRILWLHHGGLEHDDTDAHIDTLARLCPNDTIVYGEGCHEMEEELKMLRTAEGNPYRLLSVPPYYANFLIMNGAVLLPLYGGDSDTPNEDGFSRETDLRAKAVLKEAFPDREIIGIDCRVLLRQNGSLHCCTMQFPA